MTVRAFLFAQSIPAASVGHGLWIVQSPLPSFVVFLETNDPIFASGSIPHPSRGGGGGGGGGAASPVSSPSGSGAPPSGVVPPPSSTVASPGPPSTSTSPPTKLGPQAAPVAKKAKSPSLQ